MMSDVKFRCKVSSYSYHSLWKEYSNLVEWGERRSILGITMGTFHRLPVVVSISIVNVAHNKVVFWEPTSTLVDHRIIEAWFEEHWQPIKPRNHSDDNNFGNYIGTYRGYLPPNRFLFTKESPNSFYLWVSEDAPVNVHRYLAGQVACKPLERNGPSIKSLSEMFGQKEKILGYRIQSSMIDQVVYTMLSHSNDMKHITPGGVVERVFSNTINNYNHRLSEIFNEVFRRYTEKA